MKFVSIKFSTLKFLKFFVTLIVILLNTTTTISAQPQKSETDKLKEKINPIEKKTTYEKMLKNIDFIQMEKNKKFSIAKRDIKVKNFYKN